MLQYPEKTISERALPVWRLTGLIHSSFIFLACIAITIITFLLQWPKWIILLCGVMMALYAFLFVYLIPLLRWKRWRYEVREQEIELLHGIFIIKRTLIPMIRVQHVDTRQGPILRKYGLASVTVSTAATEHEIPALDIDEAEELRIFISRLARVADEDV